MTALPLRDFTAAEQERLDAIEAAPAADESLSMRVANAVAAVFRKEIATGYVSPTQCVDAADAAIAVLSGPSSDAEQAVERVLALADRHEECCGVVNIDSLREAVADPTC